MAPPAFNRYALNSSWLHNGGEWKHLIVCVFFCFLSVRNCTTFGWNLETDYDIGCLLCCCFGLRAAGRKDHEMLPLRSRNVLIKFAALWDISKRSICPLWWRWRKDQWTLKLKTKKTKHCSSEVLISAGPADTFVGTNTYPQQPHTTFVEGKVIELWFKYVNV